MLADKCFTIPNRSSGDLKPEMGKRQASQFPILISVRATQRAHCSQEMPWELADRAAGVARLGVPLISAPGWALSQQNNSQLQLRIMSGEITAPRMLEVCRGICIERVLGGVKIGLVGARFHCKNL